MSSKKTNAISLPEVLAFNRQLEVSDGLMHAGNWQDDINNMADAKWQDIALIEKRNRATHSQYSAKDADKSKSNLSWGDDASIPHDTDTLKLSFSLKIMGSLEQATACNKPEFQTALTTKVEAYREEAQFTELAKRYAYNIVNARYLWRNRVGAEKVMVRLKTADGTLDFKSYDYLLNNLDDIASDEQFDKLVAIFQKGLSGDGFEYIEIQALAKIGKGQRVWPSQEMVLVPAGEKSRILFAINDCAAMHSEKIGNAIRTVDTWYADGAILPIAVEPYGSVTTKGEAHRVSDNNFYKLLIKWLNDDAITANDKHFVIATLIRGGVFGGKD